MGGSASHKHWIASGVASGVFLLCAFLAIRYDPFGLLARIEIGLLSVVQLLICLYFWQAREYGKSKMGLWVWVTVVSIAWTLGNSAALSRSIQL